MQRKHQIVLFGATGFTGELVARYFAENVPLQELRWTIAGRSAEKLSRLKDMLCGLQPECSDLSPIIADTDDADSLGKMVASTSVLLTTVGPYAKYGEAVVGACVDQNTHYVDITGEPSFWYRIFDKYHDRAEAAGVRIVPCSGFESVPPDLGALFTLQQMPEDEPKVLRGFMLARGQASGGTWHSAVNAMAGLRTFNAEQRERRKDTEKRPRVSHPGIHRSDTINAWALPMPTIDPSIVHRSARLRGDYGPDFSFAYFMGMKSLTQAVGLMAGVGAAYAAAQLAPTRKWLLSLRKPGAGPSSEIREKGWFRLVIHGSSPSTEVLTEVRGGEPGYSETAKMLAESALCLAQNLDEIPGKGGILTPASAFGDILRQRLQSVGIHFAHLPIEASSK